MKLYNDSLDKASILNNYFTSVFTPITMETPPPMSEPVIPDIDSIQIETNGVVELLQSLVAHKAAGPDEIPAQLLKEFLPLHFPLSSKLLYISVLYHLNGRGHMLYPSLRRAIMLPSAITDLSH